MLHPKSALPADLRYHDVGDAIGKGHGGQYISDHLEVLSTPASTEGRLKSKIDIGNRETLAAPVVDASEAWADCARQVWEREEITVEKWKDEIANLLTFVSFLHSRANTSYPAGNISRKTLNMVMIESVLTGDP